MKSDVKPERDSTMKRDYEEDSSSASESDEEWDRPSNRPKMTMYADVEEQRQRVHAERDFKNRLNRTPWEHMLNDYTPPPPITERWKHDKWEEIMDESGRSRSPVNIRYPYRPVHEKESYYRTRDKFLSPVPSSSGKVDHIRSSAAMYAEPKNESAAALPEFQKDKARLGSVVISVDAKEDAAEREVRIVKKGEEPDLDGESREEEGATFDCPPGMRGSTWSYSTLPKSRRHKGLILKSVVREEGEISSESEDEQN